MLYLGKNEQFKLICGNLDNYRIELPCFAEEFDGQSYFVFS